MEKQLEDFAANILKSVNFTEVKAIIENDNTAVILRQFDNEIVIIKYVENDELRRIDAIYVNFRDSSYEIDELVKQEKWNTFIKLEKLDNGNVLAIYNNIEAEISIIYNYPKESSYQIVVREGASGTGSGWGKAGLGLE
ncbi:MAG: hypothetical protein PHC62_09860 [Candidatus Izemoplasmatales bacterium]|nr:hypothetical protein [Candidatus Izemoplasmatales bacterium]